MGILTKNIPKAEQDLTNVPEGLQVRRKNAIKAGYNFAFDQKEKDYITYNKLRSERPEKEVVQVAKIRRLMDRDSGNEVLVWYQTSKTYDYEDNLVRCPHVEKIGVEDAPQTTKHKNSQNQVTDIELIETKNDFYVTFSKTKLKELFEKSRNSQNIVCYIGYCKPVKETGSDYMTDKKRIKDQVAFMSKDFDELIQLNDKSNVENTYSKVSKKKMKSNNPNENEQNQEQEQQEREELEDDGLLTQKEFAQGLEKRIEDNEMPKVASTESIMQKPRKRSNTIDNQNSEQEKIEKQEQEQENQTNEEEEEEVEREENDDNAEEKPQDGNKNNKIKIKIGSLD